MSRNITAFLCGITRVKAVAFRAASIAAESFYDRVAVGTDRFGSSTAHFIPGMTVDKQNGRVAGFLAAYDLARKGH